MGNLKQRKRTAIFIALVFLVALTASLFRINHLRRRAHVPEMIVQVPKYVYSGRTPIGRVKAFAFAPRGERLAIVDDIGRWFISDLKGDKPTSLGRFNSARSGSIVWRRDAQSIYATSDGELFWLSLNDAKWREYVVAPTDKTPARPTVRISPDARFMLVSTYEEREGPWKPGALRLNEVVGKKRLWGGILQADTHGFLPFVCGAAFSPDSQTVAVAIMYFGDDHTEKTAARDAKWLQQKRLDIVLRRVSDGSVLQTIEFKAPTIEVTINGDDATNGLALAFSPAGNLLAAADINKVCLYEVQNGSLLSSLPMDNKNVGWMGEKPLAFSPDGRLLVVSWSRATEVWSIQKKERLQLFYGHARHLSFSSDGKWLASDDISNAGTEGQVKIWEVGSLN